MNAQVQLLLICMKRVGRLESTFSQLNTKKENAYTTAQVEGADS